MTKYYFLLQVKPVIQVSKCFGLLQWICNDSGVPSVSPYLVYKLLKSWFLESNVVEEIINNGSIFTTVYFVIVNIIMTLLCSHDNPSKNFCALLYITNHFSNKNIFAIGNIRKKNARRYMP